MYILGHRASRLTPECSMLKGMKGRIAEGKGVGILRWDWQRECGYCRSYHVRLHIISLDHWHQHFRREFTVGDRRRVYSSWHAGTTIRSFHSAVHISEKLLSTKVYGLPIPSLLAFRHGCYCLRHAARQRLKPRFTNNTHFLPKSSVSFNPQRAVQRKCQISGIEKRPETFHAGCCRMPTIHTPSR